MKKTLMIIGGVVVGLVLIGVIATVVVSTTSKKLVCKSDEGNIKIMYNDKTITGYTASGVSYDLDGQKKYAEQIGIEAYLDEFSNTTGTCTR